MKLLKLPVHPREKTGRGPARRQRSTGLIPAVVYGKSGVRHLTLREPDFRLLMRAVAGTAALVEIADESGAATLSLLQEVQRDSRTDRFVHVDLKEVSANETMRATVPVRVFGESIGVKMEGGVIEISRHILQVKCLPKDLPDIIAVDVTELHAGHSLHVRDLKPIPGVVFAEDADEVVAACVVPTVEEEPVAAAVPAEGEAAAGAEGAVPAEGDAAAKPGDAKAAAGAKGAAPAAGAKGAPAAGAKGAAPAAGAKGAAPAAGAKGAAPAKPAGKK